MRTITMATEQPLCLLALDGGGVRGVSELLILSELMLRIKRNNELQSTPKPCEIFDLICGTSTGGLAAILLGRLRLSVDEAIDEYRTITEKVFSKPKPYPSEGCYSATTLEEAMKDVIQRYGTPKGSSGKADAELKFLEDSSKGICKV
ncbi:acyl transferase/acyl hydrolase/lysophospholipase [Xylaria scruposa]|nr:acyl transferase/acyl hydrolase/lysophospholipase [Xylaria scruposa]